MQLDLVDLSRIKDNANFVGNNYTVSAIVKAWKMKITVSTRSIFPVLKLRVTNIVHVIHRSL